MTAILAERKKTIEKAEPQERIINNDPRTFTEAEFGVGDVSHQGDLIMVRIETLPKSAKPISERQLAIGTTQGARHVLSVGNVYSCDPKEVVTRIKSACPQSDVQSRYIGPVFTTVESAADVVHPEHGDQFFRGDMVIACVYQRSLDAEEQEQRVLD